MSNETILDLDSMMDIQMDSVQAAPDYVTPPAGVYILSVADAVIEKKAKKEQKEGAAKDYTRIRVTYAVVKTVELAQQNEPPVADGSLFSENFMGTEDGLGYFKRAAMNILNVKDFTGATLKDIMEGMKGAEFKCRLTVKKNAEGFENVQIRVINEPAAA